MYEQNRLLVEDSDSFPTVYSVFRLRLGWASFSPVLCLFVAVFLNSIVDVYVCVICLIIQCIRNGVGVTGFLWFAFCKSNIYFAIYRLKRLNSVSYCCLFWYVSDLLWSSISLLMVIIYKCNFYGLFCGVKSIPLLFLVVFKFGFLI